MNDRNTTKKAFAPMPENPGMIRQPIVARRKGAAFGTNEDAKTPK